MGYDANYSEDDVIEMGVDLIGNLIDFFVEHPLFLYLILILLPLILLLWGFFKIMNAINRGFGGKS